jgi:hypothetical protein
MRTLFSLAALILAATAQTQTLVPFLKKNGKYIYVDAASMKPVLTKEFAQAGLFDKDGLAWVNENKTDLFSLTASTGYFIDKKGNIAKSGSYELESTYNKEGLATIKVNEKTGVVNKQGAVVVQPVWDKLSLSTGTTLIAVKTNNKWGYCDKTGRLQIPPAYDEAENFYEQRAFVKIGEKWSIIDTTGKIVSHFKYKNSSWFSDGMALVTSDGERWHNINLDCKMLVPSFAYTKINSFSAGLASVKSLSGKWGLMDKKMKLVTAFEYDSIGFYSWKEPYITPVIKNGKWGCINQKGKTVVPFEYENISPFYDNTITTFQSNGKWGVIDLNGKVLIPAMYNEIEVLNNKYIMVSSGSKWALADATNKILTSFNYYPLEFNGSDFEEDQTFIEVFDSPGNIFFDSGFYIDITGREYREK